MSRATAVLPVKRLGDAKQRLSTGLSGEKRRQLMAAMFADTVEAIGDARSLERTIVVTNDADIGLLAAEQGLEVVSEQPGEGHSRAALIGIARAIELGAEVVTLLPVDCPLLDPKEIDHLIAGHPHNFVTIVPDRHGTGTNALVLSPPTAIEPSFGEGSAARHAETARSAGVGHIIEPLDSLGLDLDTPADIIALATQLGRSGRRRRKRAARTAEVLGL